MDKIESFLNDLSDMDMLWWPFLFLRPQKNEFMTNKVLLKVTLYYGFTVAILLGLIQYCRGFEYNDVFIYMVLFILFFFVLFKFSFAYFWNRRAQKLLRND